MATMLGRLLIAAGAASDEQVDGALEEQRETRERVGSILVRRGVEPEAVARALAEQLRLPYSPPPLRAEPDALELVPGKLALRHRLLPLQLRDRCIRIAMADPLDAAAIDDLQFRTGRRADPSVATEATVEAGLTRAYGAETVQAVLRRLDGSPHSDDGHEVERAHGLDGGAMASRALRGAAPSDAGGGEAELLRQASEAPPIVAVVNLLLERAVTAGASDVHIEPDRRRVQVRARVDGTLRPILELPVQSASAVTSRVKIMAGLDIAVKRRPQDGRSAITVGGQRIGVRVSTLPSQDGEKVVLRLLDPRNAVRSLDGLGLGPALRHDLTTLLHREHGLFLVTGPTGSGKTTTLYALLQSRDRLGRNVLTLEDPVEYRLEGLTQVGVHPRAGLDFAAALRAVLRQDPDVIMVGEMRDRETAETGLAAALTGHLVLSTLHTIDAPGAVSRLVEMGAPRYLVAGGLVGVLAQRLVRRLCAHCRTIEPARTSGLHELGLPTPPHLPRAVGCDQCGNTGYRGRVGVFELLRVDSTVRELILGEGSADAIREAAASAGMTPLALDAWHKVEQGLTTLEEIRPLLALLTDDARACGSCGARLERHHTFCPVCGGETCRRCVCGATMRGHWRFCGACGLRRMGEDAPLDLSADSAPPTAGPRAGAGRGGS